MATATARGGRKFIDCSEYPSEKNCTLKISGTEDEVLEAATAHAVASHSHDWRDVTFGGQAPEPGEEHIAELKQLVIEKKFTLGLATDGDADRFGVVDSNGEFITPNQLIALLTDYLAESRGWTQGVARSVATSHLVDSVAKARGIDLHGASRFPLVRSGTERLPAGISLSVILTHKNLRRTFVNDDTAER